MKGCDVCGTYTETPKSKGHLASRGHQAAVNRRFAEERGLVAVSAWTAELLNAEGIETRRLEVRYRKPVWGRDGAHSQTFAERWAALICDTFDVPRGGEMRVIALEALRRAKVDLLYRAALLAVIDLVAVPRDANGTASAFVEAHRHPQEPAA